MNNSFLFGLKLKKMGETLLSQTSNIISDSDIHMDKRSIPVLMTLVENGATSVNKLAKLLGMTHPAIVQIADKLSLRGLLSITKSTADKRLTLLEITKKGKARMDEIQPVIIEIQNSIDLAVSNIDGNLPHSLMKLDKVIRNGEIAKDVREKLIQSEMKQIEIVPFDKKYKNDFLKLNYEWLEKYFEVEEEDKRLLKNPEKEIIKSGGEVFFALLNNEVVGTCAVLHKDKYTCELTKMAVTEKARGKHIGNKLALISIGFAVEKNADFIILSTNHKLVAALNLYKSLGFSEIQKKDDERYSRDLTYMHLDLREYRSQ